MSTNSNVTKVGRTNKYHSYKLYLPNNLDIDTILESNPPEFNYYRDCFVYILHLINAIPTYKNDFDFDQYYGFIPVNKEMLRDKIHEYRKYLDYLIQNDILEEGTNHVPGKYSKGLKFTSQYRTPVKPVYITKHTLIKSIVQKKGEHDRNAEAKLSFFRKWFNQGLKIDMDKVAEFLSLDYEAAKNKIIRKRNGKKYKSGAKAKLLSIEDVVLLSNNAKYIVADKINDIYLKTEPFLVDTTSGRLHSPFTQLKKELREYVSYEGNKLCNIDIVNSQPLLALIILDINIFRKMRIDKLIARYNPNYEEIEQDQTTIPNPNTTMLVKMIIENSDKEDVIQYKRAVIGGYFYELFAERLYENRLIPKDILSIENAESKKVIIRKYAKAAIFRAFFEETSAVYWNRYVKAFAFCFPNVFSIFQLVKLGEGLRTEYSNNRLSRKKEKGLYTTLACIFQRFESNLVLHIACAEVNEKYPDIPIYTIHDSIVTTVEHAETVQQIFRNHLISVLGVEPQLKIEVWK